MKEESKIALRPKDEAKIETWWCKCRRREWQLGDWCCVLNAREKQLDKLPKVRSGVL